VPRVEVKFYTEFDEPYAGLGALSFLDELLVSALDDFESLKFEISGGLSIAQSAAIDLFPTGLSIAFSIRELIRQTYVGSARIMIRR
jgi:hypothetical protein